MTRWRCARCGQEAMHIDTCVPAVCEACSERGGFCTECGLSIAAPEEVTDEP